MQVNQSLYGYNTTNTTAAYTAAQATDEAGRSRENQPTEAQVPTTETEQQDKLTLSVEAQASSASKFEVSTSKPEDNSSKLTQRLVAAMGQFEVRQVVADAQKDLINLRMVAVVGKGDDAKLAESYIKKLEKFLRRADRKLDDLGKEDTMKLQRVRLEQQKQKKRAEEIKAKLHRKQSERRARENGYLLEDIQEQMLGQIGPYNPAAQQDFASEAAIAAQAEAIATAEISAESTGFSGGDIAMGVSVEASTATETGGGTGGDVSAGGEAPAPA